MAFVKIEIRGDKAASKYLGGFGAPEQSIYRAINKGVAKAKTETWNTVKVGFPIKQSQLYKSIYTKKAGPFSLSGWLKAYPRKWTYLEVGGATELKKGVKVQPRKGIRKTAIGAIVGSSRRGGKEYVWVPKKHGQYGLEVAQTFSAAQMLDDPPGSMQGNLRKVQQAAADAYEKELLRQIDLIAART